MLIANAVAYIGVKVYKTLLLKYIEDIVNMYLTQV